MYLVLGSSSMIGVTVTLWQSCQPAAAPLYAYQCSAVQTVDLSWHRGSPGWVTGSDIRSASGISVPALPWQLPASHTATASPWLPPHLDTTPGNWNRRRQRQMESLMTLDSFNSYFFSIRRVEAILKMINRKDRQRHFLQVFLQSYQYSIQRTTCVLHTAHTLSNSVHSVHCHFPLRCWTNRLLITHCTSFYIY